MEGIDHDGQFPRLLLADALLHRAGMRSVGDTGWMQGHHPAGDMLAAHEIPVNIVQQFIAVDIAMVVGRRNTLGMVVVHPGDEGADHKIVAFKGLVDGRWLMHPTRDGFKVVNAEREGVTAAVPSDHIEGMMSIVQAIKHPLLFCLYQKIARLVDRGQPVRRPDVTLAVRGVLQELTVFTVVSFRIADRAEGFDDE